MSGDRSIDDVYPALATRRRRYLLYCLHVYANPVTLADAAERITRWERDDPADELLDARLQVYMSLYHDHVPELADAGLVAYSQEEDMVELTDRATRIREALERTAERDLGSDAPI